jgi:hypothetical protein
MAAVRVDATDEDRGVHATVEVEGEMLTLEECMERAGRALNEAMSDPPYESPPFDPAATLPSPEVGPDSPSF